jgi:hypothetical protein
VQKVDTCKTEKSFEQYSSLHPAYILTVLTAGVGFTDWHSGIFNILTMSSKFVSIFISNINWSSCESDNGNKSKQAGCRLEYCSQDFSVLKTYTGYIDIKTKQKMSNTLSSVLRSSDNNVQKVDTCKTEKSCEQ